MITVDREVCINCGACVAVCPAAILGMGDEGPEAIKKCGCIKCGHCVAVCPVAALDHEKAPLQDQIEIKPELTITQEQAEQFLRSRRSIRNYKKEKASKEKIEKLLDLARMAPTGRNNQGTDFMVIESVELMETLKGEVVAFMEAALESNPAMRGYKRIIEGYAKGEDPIFFFFSQLNITLNDEGAPIRHANGQFALTYAELFAPVIGLGTCWAGFFMWYATAQAEKVKVLLQIPAEKKITAAVMVGIPQYQYKRVAAREELKIDWR